MVAQKLALGIFSESGEILFKESLSLEKRKGSDVGAFITGRITEFLKRAESEFTGIRSIGISVPGISYQTTGKVWDRIYLTGLIILYVKR